MKIPYVENDATETIKLIIDPEMNMHKMITVGVVDNPSDNYADNCYNMCNISTYIIGNQILDICDPDSLIVHEGAFAMMGNHTWLEIEDVIIDATLQQFVPEAEKLSLIDAKFEAYQSVNRYTFNEWVEKSPNVGT